MIYLQNHVLVTIVFYSLCKCQDFRSKEFKHILLWDEPDAMPLSLFMTGENAFQLFDCPVSKCYVTSNKNFFHGSLKNFDAIVFNGKSSPGFCSLHRCDHQKYIFASMEPESELYVCDENYDGFFNWTASHRLTSDFIFPFILMKNATGHIVGPRNDTAWPTDMQETDLEFSNMLQSKTKLAAWFVANCTFEYRNEFVNKLQKALQKYHLSIDIFGRCGKYKCAKSECLDILKRDYFFYLALESTEAQDYVTEKIIPALQNYVVPIVYGETNYSRFLPPNSYLNGKNMSVEDLADTMRNLMESPLLYKDYFKWRRYYRFSSSKPEGAIYKGKGICQICEALHNEDIIPTETVVQHFRKWVDPHFEEKCGDENIKNDTNKTENDQQQQLDQHSNAGDGQHSNAGDGQHSNEGLQHQEAALSLFPVNDVAMWFKRKVQGSQSIRLPSKKNTRNTDHKVPDRIPRIPASQSAYDFYRNIKKRGLK